MWPIPLPFPRVLGAVLVVSSLGCGASKTCDSELAPISETSISEGIAGRALSESNIGLGCSASSENLALYASSARVTTEQQARELTEAVTPQIVRVEERHETPLSPGEYLACAGLCSPLTLEAGKVLTVHALRRDGSVWAVVYDAQGNIEPTFTP